MTIHQTVEEIRRTLSGMYPETEIRSFINILFRHFLQMTPVRAQLSKDSNVQAGDEQRIHDAVGELKRFRPIQYILGETEFCGLSLELTPDVLIPRPETEELADWIVHTHDRREALRIADIGTGSGCIAVALAAQFPNAVLWAADVSEAALAVARRNAVKNGVNINFAVCDVLRGGLTDFASGVHPLDVVVSNPPYVTAPERELMHTGVLAYEPHVALFAPDGDPLAFYGQIAAFGSKCLKDGGKIFFEINEAFPEETADILHRNGYSDVVTRRDINGRWRMVAGTCCRKSA